MATADRSGLVIDGRYRLEKLIGRGAMADVYRARDDEAGVTVAVKILRDQLTRDHEAVARFQREAEVQAKIQHRNVAALYGSGVTDAAEPYLVVELLRGHSLRAVLKQQGSVAPARALSYAWQALQGLAAVHAQGVLHRDLKPANLMLEPSPGPVERVIVIDFGFAALEGGQKLTGEPEEIVAQLVEKLKDVVRTMHDGNVTALQETYFNFKNVEWLSGGRNIAERKRREAARERTAAAKESGVAAEL